MQSIVLALYELKILAEIIANNLAFTIVAINENIIDNCRYRNTWFCTSHGK